MYYPDRIFPNEVSQGLPSATSLASCNLDRANKIAKKISSKNFQVYVNDDVVGTQTYGAVKNVLAIACGIFMGQNLGHNAVAALLTRGMKEIVQISDALGGKKDTILEVCGIGDFVLTCTSLNSRNVSLGFMIGKNDQNIKKYLKNTTVEGFYTIGSVKKISETHSLDLPICDALFEVLYNGKQVDLIREECFRQ